MAAESQAEPFYTEVLTALLAEGVVKPDSSILAICGGPTDRDSLLAVGCENVTIANLDERQKDGGRDLFAPYAWSYQDAERMSYDDASFDFVVVHSGLHHLHCPQKGLTEMYRVATKGVLGFEPHRNLFTALGVRLGFGQEYETAAVFYNDCRFGGVANTNVPNYVARFTRQDVVRAIQTYAPVARHRFRFWFRTRVPARLEKLRDRRYRLLVRPARSLLGLAGHVPFLANNLAFYVAKPDLPRDLFPWLKLEDGAIRPDTEHLSTVYKNVDEIGS